MPTPKKAKRLAKRRPKAQEKPLPHKRPAEANSQQNEPLFPPSDNFFIVGIGASAGGLEAFRLFFQNMPADSNMAFVLIPHLEPTHVSLLPELLRKETAMEVQQAEEEVRVEPNHVYIIPPNRGMGIHQGTLSLEKKKDHKTIDDFLISLADDQGPRAIGILLSGMGTDGVLGLKEILQKGGRTIVQEPKSAKFSGMPEAAVNAEAAESILSPEEIPGGLLAYARQGIRPRPPAMIVDSGEKISAVLPSIFPLIKQQTGHDFSSYKRSTIVRRIDRRMKAQQIGDPADYARYLERNPDEVQSLFKDFLIGVTQFFRDPDTFKVLREKVLPRFFKGKPERYSARVWVIGCSTGEEAYSLGIVLQEFIEKFRPAANFQIFGTDIDAESISSARTGLFSPAISADVSPERLERCFVREENGYRIRKELREKFIFSVQDIAKDPPFNRMDIICCRNLLIYMDKDLQNRTFAILHYSLNPGGILFLGASENIPAASMDLFSPLDQKGKIFARTETQRVINPPANLVGAFSEILQESRNKENMGSAPSTERIASSIEKQLLEVHAPPCVVINDQNQIMYVSGSTGDYLELPRGKPPLDLMQMAREGLRAALSAALRKARSQRQRVSSPNVRVKAGGSHRLVNLTLTPLPDRGKAGWFIIAFEDARAPRMSVPVEKKGRKIPKRPGGREPVEELEKELEFTRESLKSAIEELQTSNEEQKSITEEYMSANEELQSANEELQSSREEMQSLNEELNTVNAELQHKLNEVAQNNEEINTFLDSLEIPSLMLDRDLRIRRFSAPMAGIMNLIKSDIGRPLRDITSLLKGEDLAQAAGKVLKSEKPFEKEVETTQGHCFFLRILPYRRAGRTGGVVLNFINLEEIKASREQMRLTREEMLYADSIVNTIREPLLVLDSELKVISANPSFYKFFQVKPEETEGHFIFDLGSGKWDIPQLRSLFEGVIQGRGPFEGYVVENEFPKTGHRKLAVNARRVVQKEAGIDRILVAIEGFFPATPVCEERS